ncbi:hypothetical protein, partial [Vibrio cyclitrophicus]|uniref:hypothetical protein n=1 Tax=Vibrio cyclitrophicus TaxID=47951 RepID=UPI0018E95F69
MRILFIFLLAFSSSSFSKTYYKVYKNWNNIGACKQAVGAIFSPDSCIGSIAYDFGVEDYPFTITSVYYDGGALNVIGTYENGGKTGGVLAQLVEKIAVCEAGTTYNPATSQCENSNPCEQMKGESLGNVTFPDGTRDVASLCRNSCKAKSDFFFPAATPPFGVFTYTGESCDGSESSGGETGGGETGGGETG